MFTLSAAKWAEEKDEFDELWCIYDVIVNIGKQLLNR